jgi:predicted lipid-binding transport protein (Tim44 family)
MSCPTVSVPIIKANDAEPRIQPYSNSFPANRGLAALTDNASAREVVGASEAAWITAMKSSKAKECAHHKAAADAAANAVQIARAKRNEPARSANIPTIGPATRRVTMAAASTMPIS